MTRENGGPVPKRDETSGPSRRAFLRPAVDAVAAFVFLMLLSLTFASAPSSANPHNPGLSAHFERAAKPALGEADVRPIVEIATAASPQAPDAVYRRTSSFAAWILLSLAFSVLAAFNLAFLRHMRKAYANPRRKAKI